MTQSSDEDRFRLLFDSHWADIVRYLWRRTSGVDVESLAGDVFSIAWQRLDAVPVEHELPWLYVTARNVLSNHQRREWRTVVVAPPESPTVDGELDAVDLAHDVQAVLSLLSDADREVLALASWEQLDANEASTVLGCSAVAYRVRLHRARRRLKAAMQRRPRSAGDQQNVLQ